MIDGTMSHLLQHAMQSEQVQTAQSAVSPSGATAFAGVMHSMMQESAVLEQKAKDAVMGVMQGNGVELHDAMIATQKADMSFELALQVRNKAVAAYQTMMGMQF
ncbi:flagellar hook-basal body complex protein FliE [Granulicella cerasi]|uniref:Flagellar hook-basal body complex protein FliE n=1 Tax=Granulicella cerasi TaxID=741063 RepID=A0ABW1Z5L0_9BACT|nr:flagellar hook-basal body complex protein FliE [Granulicella cerasi]